MYLREWPSIPKLGNSQEALVWGNWNISRKWQWYSEDERELMLEKEMEKNKQNYICYLLGNKSNDNKKNNYEQPCQNERPHQTSPEE